MRSTPREPSALPRIDRDLSAGRTAMCAFEKSAMGRMRTLS
ncbi:hypothetical protein XccvBFoX4_gp07 [Xanthomonas phage FoX4]|uniref:Uncharacterized protein n=1 Tax=Xanthomonas phage FoX4 TaxID=2723900 RepID=A0A858WLE7_9CAUD|nr:hypothetical protein KNU97_gp07 [Xanthomonas phage FoX4]QJI52961.1 hypothetical protein XccvBFoX4_gp07 [Xanthomonas phage FoX4]